MPSLDTDQQTILFLAASPRNINRLRLDQELRDVSARLRRNPNSLNLEYRLAVRPCDIQSAMLDVNPQIVHFSGHGRDEGLIFEDDFGNAKLVEGTALAGLFKLFGDQLRCVVLNSCYSEVQAKAIAQHIPYVIGMSQAIGDKAAIAFAVGFYDALRRDCPIKLAYELGCNAIRMEGIAENLTPILLTHPTRAMDPLKKGLSLVKLLQFVAPDKELSLIKLLQFVAPDKCQFNLDITVRNNTKNPINLVSMDITFTSEEIRRSGFIPCSYEKISAKYKVVISPEQISIQVASDNCSDTEIVYPNTMSYEGRTKIELWQSIPPGGTDRFQVYISSSEQLAPRSHNIAAVTLVAKANYEKYFDSGEIKIDWR
jgi:hypothetical protein